MASRNNGQFVQVRFKSSGKTKPGYVAKDAVVGWEIYTPQAQRRSKYSIFVSTVGAYYRQGRRDLQTAADSIYSVSEFSGFSTFSCGTRKTLWQRVGCAFRSCHAKVLYGGGR